MGRRKWILKHVEDCPEDSAFHLVTYLIIYNKKDHLLNTYRFPKPIKKSKDYRKYKVRSVRVRPDDWTQLLKGGNWYDGTYRKPKPKPKPPQSKPKAYW